MTFLDARDWRTDSLSAMKNNSSLHGTQQISRPLIGSLMLALNMSQIPQVLMMGSLLISILVLTPSPPLNSNSLLTASPPLIWKLLLIPKTPLLSKPSLGENLDQRKRRQGTKLALVLGLFNHISTVYQMFMLTLMSSPTPVSWWILQHC